MRIKTLSLVSSILALVAAVIVMFGDKDDALVFAIISVSAAILSLHERE